MASDKLQVGFYPCVTLRTPDGRVLFCGSDDLQQILRVLLTYELLWIEDGPGGGVYSGEDVEIHDSGPEGTTLRIAKHARTPSAVATTKTLATDGKPADPFLDF